MTSLRTCAAIAAVLTLSACADGGFSFPGMRSSGGGGGTGTTAATGTTSGQGMTGQMPGNRTTGTMTSASNLDIADQSFLMHAAQSGLAEVELGQLAQRQASSQVIRDMGRRIAAEHTQANQELVQIARSKGITPPTQTDAGRQAIAAQLSQADGANFDRQFLMQQLSNHEMAVALYENQARNGTDPQVRGFASKWLPSIRNHTQDLRQMTQRMASR